MHQILRTTLPFAAAALVIGAATVCNYPSFAADSTIEPAEPAATESATKVPIRAPEPDALGAAAPASVSWETVASNMQSAQTLLAAGDAGSATQRRQREIVEHLDAMIAAASARSADTSGQASNPRSQDNASSTPGDSPSPDGRAANPNAVESVERHGKGEVKAPEAAGPKRTAAEEFWGQLPEHIRQRVLQSAENRAVPKYRTAVEEYFQRLLESQSRPDGDN
jgi:hypothetical protein